MSTYNINMGTALTDVQNTQGSSLLPSQSADLKSQVQLVAKLLRHADAFVVTDSQMNELTKLSVSVARGDFSVAAENLRSFSCSSSSSSDTVTVEESLDNHTSQSSVSMAELLALMTAIIESSHELRSQVMQNRILEASATCDLAVSLAADKCHDAQTKFGITLAASIVTMGISTFATVRMAQPKKLQDKHVRSMSGDDTVTVKSLDAKTRNDYAARLQDARTGKYRGVSQGAEIAQGVVGNVNEIQNAAQVRNQEETQATKDMKEKFDAQLDQYIQNLTQETTKLNEILDSIAKASLVTNR